MGDETINGLLEQLASDEVAGAWQQFLSQYSRLIMHVVRRHGLDEESAAECYVHICHALSDDKFRRLRRFQPRGPARFTTWLMAVVANLCVDWRRSERGRARPLRAITRLPELEQQVYHCIYVQRMSRRQCAQALAATYPELTETAVAEINARLFALLTPQQRWQLSLRPPTALPANDAADDEEPEWQVPQPGPGPDELAERDEEQRRLQQALGRLPAEQRLLLRLRYEQNLTLAEVARLTQQPDPFRVNRQVRAALVALAALMEGQPMGDAKNPATCPCPEA